MSSPGPNRDTTLDLVKEGLALICAAFIANTAIDLCVAGPARLFDQAFALRMLRVGVAALVWVSATRLGRVPPAVRLDQVGLPYRNAPARVERAQLAGISRTLSAASLAWPVFGVVATACSALNYRPWAPLETVLALAPFAAELATTALIAIWCLRAKRELGLRIALALPLSIIALDLVFTFGEVMAMHGGVPIIIRRMRVLLSIAVALQAYLAGRAARAWTPANPDSARPAPAADRASWIQAAAGLGRARAALKGHLAALVVAVLLFCASLSHVSSPLVTFGLFALVASLVLQVVMWRGLGGYTRQPEASGGSTMARAARVLIGLAILANVFALLSLALIWTSATRVLSSACTAWLVLSVGGTVALVLSFRKVASYCGDEGLARRARSVNAFAVCLLVGGLCAALAAMYASPVAGGLIALALLLATFALPILVLGLSKAIEARMNERSKVAES
jgi:hypothetical protein